MNATTMKKRKETRFIWSAFLILLLLTSSVSAINVQLRTKAETHASNTRNALSAQLYLNMEKCVRIGRKMDIAGADIRGSLLPELRQYLYALEQMTIVANEETPLYAPALIQSLFEDCENLESCYASGRSYEESLSRLTRDLERINNLLSQIA